MAAVAGAGIGAECWRRRDGVYDDCRRPRVAGNCLIDDPAVWREAHADVGAVPPNQAGGRGGCPRRGRAGRQSEHTGDVRAARVIAGERAAAHAIAQLPMQMLRIVHELGGSMDLVCRCVEAEDDGRPPVLQ